MFTFVYKHCSANSFIVTNLCSIKLEMQQMNQIGKIKKRKKRRSKFDLCNIYNLNQRPQNTTSAFTDQSLDLRPQQLRTAFTDEQTLILEASYQKNTKPCNTQKALVANLCNLPFETVRIWYQNRRAKEKRVQEDELAFLAEKLNATKANEHLKKLDVSINDIFCTSDEQIEEESFIRQLLREKRKPRDDLNENTDNTHPHHPSSVKHHPSSIKHLSSIKQHPSSIKQEDFEVSQSIENLKSYQKDIKNEEEIIDRLLNENDSQSSEQFNKQEETPTMKTRQHNSFNTTNYFNNPSPQTNFPHRNQHHLSQPTNIHNNNIYPQTQKTYPANSNLPFWNNSRYPGNQMKSAFPWANLPATNAAGFPNTFQGRCDMNNDFRFPFYPNNISMPPYCFPPFLPPFQDFTPLFSMYHQLAAMGIPLTPDQMEAIGMSAQPQVNTPEIIPKSEPSTIAAVPTKNISDDLQNPTNNALRHPNNELRHPRSWYFPDGIPKHLLELKKKEVE